MTPWLFLLAPLLLVGALWYRRLRQRRRREQLLATPLSPQQRETVERFVPLSRRLPDSLRPAFEGKINLFLDQIAFHGTPDHDVSEEMKLSVAAQACLLIVNSPVWYDTLRTVLIYPSTFFARRPTHDGFVVHEQDASMAGESWARGPVVLSWDHALQGGLVAHDGQNVVIHEFAHQLDNLTGHTNGIPILRKGQAYAGWEQAMLGAYQAHVDKVASGQPTLIDAYGATNHQEFFAVVVVTFFEQGAALRRQEPALYAQLSELFALDPAEWG